jgi:hypothetical protein
MIRSDARLAQIVHKAIADELRISECGFRNGGEQPLMRRARRLRRPETSHCSPRYRAHDPL